MIFTFPRFGEANIYMRLFLDSIGAEYILPSPNDEDAMNFGSLEAPEGMCLPYKLFLANLKMAYDRGADTVIMPSPLGPCRLGAFASLLKLQLDRMGCKMEWIVLSTPGEIGCMELIRRLSRICTEPGEAATEVIVSSGDEHSGSGLRANATDGHKQISRSKLKRRFLLFKSIIGCMRIIKQYEDLKNRACELAGYADHPQELNILLKCCRQKLEEAESIDAALSFLGRYRFMLEKIECKKSKKPIRVLITGEIYTLIEPFANGNIEEKLTEMGVSFVRPVTIGWWLRKVMMNPIGRKIFSRLPQRHMPYSIGGYAKDTVFSSSESQYRNIRGVIQVLPFGCMPEIVAKEALNRLSSEEGVHIMSLIYDELHDETGYMTRIEAFVDMLQREADKDVLYGR